MCKLQNRDIFKRKRRRKRILPRLCRNRYLIIGITILLLSGTFTGCTASKKIPEPEKVTETQIKTQSFKDEALDFEVEIPDGWEEQENDNSVEWTEKSTGTTISVQSIDYNPVINNVTQDNVLSVVNDNGELTNYRKSAGNVIELALTKQNSESKTIIENVYIKWSFSKIYIVKYECEEKYVVYFQEYYDTVKNSLKTVNKADCIQDGYAGYYNADTNVYAEYPFSWSFDKFNTGFTVTSPDTGTTITVDNAVPISNFSEMTDVEYLEIMKRAVSNIALTSYQNTGDRVIAELYYQDDTTQYYVYNTMVDCTDFTINITYFADSNYAQQDLPYLEALINSVSW